MQNNRPSHASRIWSWTLAALAIALFAGCESVPITNLTPSTLPENPSQIYTFSARITPKASTYVQGSLNPRIVIDGQIHPMTRSPLGQDIYEFEYQIPAGRSEVAYYYLVGYRVETNRGEEARETYTGVQHANLANRYVLSLEATRGPVGARISVLGRGFTAQDVVTLDGVPAHRLRFAQLAQLLRPRRRAGSQLSGARERREQFAAGRHVPCRRRQSDRFAGFAAPAFR